MKTETCPIAVNGITVMQKTFNETDTVEEVCTSVMGENAVKDAVKNRFVKEVVLVRGKIVNVVTE